MVRGKTIFKCTDCGNHFEDLDIVLCNGIFPTDAMPQVWQLADTSVRPSRVVGAINLPLNMGEYERE